MTGSKRRKGVTRILDAILASIILTSLVAVASLHIMRSNKISNDSELNLEASTLESILENYEKNGLLYYYVNATDSNSLYKLLENTLSLQKKGLGLNVTILRFDSDSYSYITVSSAGSILKDYVVLTYFVPIAGSNTGYYYELQVMLGYGKEG